MTLQNDETKLALENPLQSPAGEALRRRLRLRRRCIEEVKTSNEDQRRIGVMFQEQI